MGEESKRQTFLALAKLAEQAERYEDMVTNMKNIIELGFRADELSQEERNLISVGYKNMMSVRRTSWRTVQSQVDKEQEADRMSDQTNLLAKYQQTVAAEICAVIDKVCADVVKPFTEGPLAANEPETLVFFRKMEGDYYRYGAEISEGDQRVEFLNKAQTAYKAAQEVCEQEGESGLAKTNPIWLGLALNFSVFYYEICDKTDEAKSLAKTAFDAALEDLDKLGEDQYKDSTLIMQLLKDNLTLWSENDDADMEVQDMEN